MTGIIHEDQHAHLLSYVVQFFLERKLFQTNVVKKIKTHISHSGTFFFLNLAVYEIKWKTE